METTYADDTFRDHVPVSKFQESRIFLTAAEMDVFTLLAKNPMSAQEIADRLEATVRGVTILLDAVVSMGLLEKKMRRTIVRPK